MTKPISHLLNTATQALAGSSASPRLDAEVLLAHVLNQTRSYLFTWPEQVLSDSQTETFHRLIAHRLQGRPVAYITGIREFWSLSLKVSPDVLIPRPDTELLVETALKLFPHDQALQIADLGTGSGAIAIALAHERPHWQITAADKSPAALVIARHNAERHQLANITFIESNWFSTLPAAKFHAIISNPPYIADSDPHLSEGDVRFEPQAALISSQGGLADLAKLITEAKIHLLPGGRLLLEHGYQQAQAVRNSMEQAGYRDIQHGEDLAGINRITYGRI